MQTLNYKFYILYNIYLNVIKYKYFFFKFFRHLYFYMENKFAGLIEKKDLLFVEIKPHFLKTIKKISLVYSFY